MEMVKPVGLTKSDKRWLFFLLSGSVVVCVGLFVYFAIFYTSPPLLQGYNVTRQGIDKSYQVFVETGFIMQKSADCRSFYVHPVVFLRLTYEQKRDYGFILYCKSAYDLNKEPSEIYIKDGFSGKTIAIWNKNTGLEVK